MKVGISTSCMYPQYTELTIQQYVKAGVSCAELFVNTDSEIKGQYLKKIKEMADGGGMEIPAVHPFTSGYEPVVLFTEYRRRFDDTLEYYKRFFEAARFLGASYVHLHGPGVRPREQWDMCIQLYGELSEEAKRWGVSITQENACKFLSRDPDYLRELRRQITDVCFLLDIKQAVRSGLDPFDVADAMGDRIVHVHVSDHTPGRDCLPPGTGEFLFGKLTEKLKMLPNQPALIVELYRDGFQNLDDLMKSCRFLQDIIATQFTK